VRAALQHARQRVAGQLLRDISVCCPTPAIVVAPQHAAGHGHKACIGARTARSPVVLSSVCCQWWPVHEGTVLPAWQPPTQQGVNDSPKVLQLHLDDMRMCCT
jgi:hypothetical protein